MWAFPAVEATQLQLTPIFFCRRRNDSGAELWVDATSCIIVPLSSFAKNSTQHSYLRIIKTKKSFYCTVHSEYCINRELSISHSLVKYCHFFSVFSTCVADSFFLHSFQKSEYFAMIAVKLQTFYSPVCLNVGGCIFRFAGSRRRMRSLRLPRLFWIIKSIHSILPDFGYKIIRAAFIGYWSFVLLILIKLTSESTMYCESFRKNHVSSASVLLHHTFCTPFPFLQWVSATNALLLYIIGILVSSILKSFRSQRMSV